MSLKLMFLKFLFCSFYLNLACSLYLVWKSTLVVTFSIISCHWSRVITDEICIDHGHISAQNDRDPMSRLIRSIPQFTAIDC